MAKSALCIGINNYPGTDMDLAGCVNDAHDWAGVLAGRGFSVQTVVDAQATKAAMVDAMGGLIRKAASGDSVVITYSGHGTYAPDIDGDESDGLDEALCPYDIKQGKVVLDDEIHALFAQRAAGVRIVLLSDSCHSGTVTRAAGSDPDAQGPKPRFMPMGNWLPDSALPRAANGAVASRVAITTASSPFTRALAAGDLLLSGCAEGPNNFSYDAQIAGRGNGAFTYYALKALKKMTARSTYADWHAEIRKSLPSANYPQTPQLVGSKAVRRAVIFS
jgi:uncharacterized caspase-like protein